MLKFILIAIFVTTMLQAQYNPKECKSDLKKMIDFFYAGERAYSEKDYDKATEQFQSSKESAYSALESCEQSYDFNMMYNYILGSENKIHEIEEDRLD